MTTPKSPSVKMSNLKARDQVTHAQKWRTFLGCTNLTEINYLGTMSQWNSIVRYGSGWDQDTGDYIVKCTDGTISKNS